MLIERNMFNEYVLPVGHQQKNIMVSRDALKGLNAGGAFQFVGRCPTLLINKAFSLNLTAMRCKLDPAAKKNIFPVFLIQPMKTFFTFATLNGMLSGVSCVYLRVVGKPRECCRY